ncbi:CheA signal transduction histidine kinase [Thermaerobacter marianensis DSM 12885]|uniref:Chemotaxis protein CheA n=1 Tax=Thermaerobacter marianensis (strain ATCC 700841 / DSM 12885 / JCM 10246 / 7p75a) TaxID=644966 RepID=E6SJU6_THEM7|nr:chemotaxis protein CheA [Thermaerobacter marianensis]ADU52179.1 CheA signal transduction histidine kinase [Thermaerobacter marianensis DSM 12885]
MTPDPWFELSEDERQLFLAEGAELLDQLEAGLLDLEAGRAGTETIHAVFRAAHTLKGSAATVGLDGMARLTHVMENRLDAWRHGYETPGPAAVSAMLAAVDGLREMLAAVAAGGDPPPPPAALLAALEGGGSEDEENGPPATAPDGARAVVPAAARDGAPDGARDGGLDAAPGATPAAAHPPDPVGDGGPGEAAGPETDRTRDAWRVEAELDPGCLMPAVRALQVLLALEDRGLLMASEPSREGLDASWNGRLVRAWVAGRVPAADLKAAVAAIPDVVAVRVEPSSGDQGDRSAAPRSPAEEAVPPGAGPGAPEADGKGRPGAPAPEGMHGAPKPARRTSGVVPAGPDGSGGPAAHAAPSADDRTIRVDVELLDRLLNLVGELVVERGRLSQLGQELARRPAVHDVADELFRLSGQIARITGALQDAVLQARMLPVARLFRRFPRLVRDLALMLGKEVELELSGEDTELDRTLHQVVADPLLHLVRNALDHGIEPPDERRRAGKPAAGRLRLAASREGHHVLIRVEDDGRGIDPQRLRRAAVEKGLLTHERAAALTDREALDLMFLPGFSTAARVTGVSGRGVGLDVVRQRLEQAGGRVEVETRPGAGTAFILLLPLTLATLRALLVEVDGQLYALPLADVGEAVRVAPEDLRSLQGRWVTTVRGQVVPLLWLRQFGDPRFRPRPDGEPLVAVLVERQGQPVGLVVDRLLGEQEVVVKGLGELLAGTRGLSGATILGDGRLALITDTPALVAELAFGTAAAMAQGPEAALPGRGREAARP